MNSITQNLSSGVVNCLTLHPTGGFKIDLVDDFGFKQMTLQLKVPNIACSACVSTVTKAVTTIDPTAKVEADTKTKLVSIETEKSETAIKEAIASAGYPAA